MNNLDLRVEGKAHHLCYVLAEKLGRPMDGKERHDIFYTIRAVAAYWKEKYDEMKKANYEKRWHELRIWLRENPNASLKDTQSIMLHLDNGDYIRDIKVK